MQKASSEQSSKAILNEQSLLLDFFFAEQKVAIFYNFFLPSQRQLHPELISVYFAANTQSQVFQQNLFMSRIKCFVEL